jgi:hypothetical protein
MSTEWWLLVLVMIGFVVVSYQLEKLNESATSILAHLKTQELKESTRRRRSSNTTSGRTPTVPPAAVVRTPTAPPEAVAKQ